MMFTAIPDYIIYHSIANWTGNCFILYIIAFYEYFSSKISLRCAIFF